MKMMLFCFVLLSVAIIYKCENILNNPSGLIEDSLFYDETYYLKKIQIKKFKDELMQTTNKGNVLNKPTIKNLNEFIQNNNNENLFDFEIKDRGNCTKVFDLAEIYKSTNEKITENIKYMKNYLNEINHIFKDEFENFIIYSVCGDLFNTKCHNKHLFVSKSDFQFFEFSQVGEKIPKLTGYSLDFIIDTNSNKKIIYLFGGIDHRGIHNQDLFRIEYDYIFGNVRIIKSGVNQGKQIGVSESSLNILSHSSGNKNDEILIFTYGGINDELISDKLSVFNPVKHSWSQINSDKSFYLPNRKGHSSIIVNAEDIQISLDTFTNPLNKELIKTFYLIFFGGKSENEYHNDLIIVQINYMNLDDTHFYKSYTKINSAGVIPTPREGHKAYLSGNFMYVVGGCNYERKKCYNDEMYRVDLSNSPFKWERIELNLNTLINNRIDFTNKFNQLEKNLFDEKNLNTFPVRQGFLNFGFCSTDGCDTSVKIILNNLDCKCLNKEIVLVDSISENKNIIPIGIRKKLKLTCREYKKVLNFNEFNYNNTTLIKNENVNENEDNHNFINNVLPKLENSKLNNTNSNGKIEDIEIIRNNSEINNLQVISNLNENSTNINYFDELLILNQSIVDKNIKDAINIPDSNHNVEIIVKNDKQVLNSNLNISLVQIHNDTITNSTKSIHKKKHKKHHKKSKNKFQKNKTMSLIITNSTNKEISRIINEALSENLKPILKENEQLRKALIISSYDEEEIDKSSEIENLSKNDTFLNFLQFKAKFNKKRKIIDQNLNYTKEISKNITEIKDFIQNMNIKTHNDINKYFKVLSKNFEISTENTNKQIEIFENFKNEQNKINKKVEELNKVKCVNGYLLNFTNCQCIPGYAGETCEVKLSCNNDCNNNGLCKFGKCYCNPGYIGDDCRIKQECLNNCNFNGKCLYGKCFCDAGFTGEDCGTKNKCENDCNNKGICFRGKCLCEPGYFNKDCSKMSIEFAPCKDFCNQNGLCKLEKCFCYPGYSGKFCEIKNEFACPPFKLINNLTLNTTKNYNNTNHTIINHDLDWIPCNGNGVCKYGKCFCSPGFKGEDCSITTEISNLDRNLIKKINSNSFFQDMKFKEIDTQSNISKIDKISIQNYNSINTSTSQIINSKMNLLNLFNNSTSNPLNLKEDDYKQRIIYSTIIIAMLLIVIFFALILSRKDLS